MFFVALATDYDGTLAQHGQVDAATRQAIEDLRQSGRKVILVTGRTLADLADAFGDLKPFNVAEGELGEDKSFHFRGPEGALNLRAQNLSTFLQLADGVDDKTWLHHLRAGAYSQWFRDAIKDDGLASEAVPIEQDHSLTAADSRARIRDIVERRYAAPAKSS